MLNVKDCLVNLGPGIQPGQRLVRASSIAARTEKRVSHSPGRSNTAYNILDLVLFIFSPPKPVEGSITFLKVGFGAPMRSRSNIRSSLGNEDHMQV